MTGGKNVGARVDWRRAFDSGSARTSVEMCRMAAIVCEGFVE
ncbi:hypothetical protein BURMUCGD1_3981 [Burkholderia multivorans CGD1]|nr:hypothetical protein BURMUCGD1_3981 [Burkholderia multivorans CGD1]